MENTPSRIAADILVAVIEAKQLYIESPVDVVTAFNDIHTAVHEAAKKDYQANLFNVFNR